MQISIEHMEFSDVLLRSETVPTEEQEAYLNENIIIRSIYSLRLFINRNPELQNIHVLKKLHDTHCSGEAKRDFRKLITGIVSALDTSISSPALVISYVGLACSIANNASFYDPEMAAEFRSYMLEEKPAIQSAIRFVIDRAKQDFASVMTLMLKTSSTEEVIDTMTQCVSHGFIDSIDPELESLLVEAKLSLSLT